MMKTVSLWLLVSVISYTMGENEGTYNNEHCPNSEVRGLSSVVTAGNIGCVIQHNTQDLPTLDIDFKITKTISAANLLVQCGTRQQATFDRALFLSKKPKSEWTINLLNNDMKSYFIFYIKSHFHLHDITLLPSTSRVLIAFTSQVISYQLHSNPRPIVWRRLKHVSLLACDNINNFVFVFQVRKMKQYSIEGRLLNRGCHVRYLKFLSVTVDTIIRRIYVGTNNGILQMPYFCKMNYSPQLMFGKSVYAISVDSRNMVLYFITETRLIGINLEQSGVTVLNRTIESNGLKSVKLLHYNRNLYCVRNSTLSVVNNGVFSHMARLDDLVEFRFLP